MSTSIDVILVNFNSGAYLERCLKSIFTSTIPLSVSVVDNASSDDSFSRVADIATHGHQLELIANPGNDGFAKAVNIGARTGEGEFIFLLNPDCEVYPHTIGDLAAALQASTEASIAGAMVFNEDGTEQRGCRRREPTLRRSIITALRLDDRYDGVNLTHQEISGDAPVAVEAVSGAAMMIRRSTFDQLGGVDEGYFLHVEDLDLCRRVRDLGGGVIFVPSVSLFHHQGVSSGRVPVLTEWFKHKGMMRYYSKFAPQNRNTAILLLSQAVVLVNLAWTLFRHTVRIALRQTNATPRLPVHLVNNETPAVVVTGASSDLGHAVLHSFDHSAERLIAVTRKAVPKHSHFGETWHHSSYFDKVPAKDLGPIRELIAVSPIWATPKIAKNLHQFGGLQQVVAISSTSVLGKANSADKAERSVVTQLLDGEHDLLEWAKQQDVDAIIGRASMIYGGRKDQSISFIARMIRLVRRFPMIEGGGGLRQPVHIDDLVTAIQNIRKQVPLPEKIYTLAGGEILSYQAMVERVFAANKLPPQFLQFSVTRLRRWVTLISKFPGFGFISPEMVSRMQKDMDYDISSAQNDFNYQPGKFRP